MTKAARDAQAPARQTLSSALDTVFAPSGETPFNQRLVSFTRALVPDSQAWVLSPDAQEGTWTRFPAKDLPENATDLAAKVVDPDQDPVQIAQQLLASRICLDNGRDAVLLADVASGGPAARAMAHERLTLLSQLSYATYRPETVDKLQRILSTLAGLDKTPEHNLQGLSDLLAAFMSADYAAVARFDGARLSDLHISGQNQAGKAAALPATLRPILSDTARLRLVDNNRAFSGDASRDDGLVFHVENPLRNAALLPFLAASAGKLAPQAAKRGFQWRKWGRRAAVVVGLGVVSFLPIPDSVSLPAEVTAVSQRVITSPLDAPLATMQVRAGDVVQAGSTTLATFDTRAVDLELIAAQAAYSRALLDRERARAGRQAADLRTAEIEAERLAAEINLLEARKETAVLVAPISGIVIGDGLGDMIGALMRRGDPVMQIADPTTLALDVSVPQSQVARIDVGVMGLFRPDFDPSLRFEATMTMISPAAPSSERAPLFPAEASVSGDLGRLRPGMTGVVAVNRDWQPIWRIVGRAARDWVLLRLWI